MPPSVIFLDIGGVTTSTIKEGEGQFFLPENVAAINWLLRETGALVVATTAWRVGLDTGEIEEMLVEGGIVEAAGRVIGKTPSIECDQSGSECRAAEIKEWLEHYGDVNYLILDDLRLGDGFGSRYHHTCPLLGLTQQEAERGVEILRGGGR